MGACGWLVGWLESVGNSIFWIELERERRLMLNFSSSINLLEHDLLQPRSKWPTRTRSSVARRWNTLSLRRDDTLGSSSRQSTKVRLKLAQVWTGAMEYGEANGQQVNCIKGDVGEGSE
jgi:hypothetical protein